MMYGQRLRDALRAQPDVPFIGVNDAFSAGIAVRPFDALFTSGLGFAASYYGLPDRGYIARSSMASFVQRASRIGARRSDSEAMQSGPTSKPRLP